MGRTQAGHARGRPRRNSGRTPGGSTRGGHAAGTCDASQDEPASVRPSRSPQPQASQPGLPEARGPRASEGAANGARSGKRPRPGHARPDPASAGPLSQALPAGWGSQRARACAGGAQPPRDEPCRSTMTPGCWHRTVHRRPQRREDRARRCSKRRDGRHLSPGGLRAPTAGRQRGSQPAPGAGCAP